MSTPAGAVATQPLNQIYINQLHSSIDKTKQMVLNLAELTASLSNKIQPGTLSETGYAMLEFAFKEVNTTLEAHQALLSQLEGFNHCWQAEFQTLREQVEQLRLNLK